MIFNINLTLTQKVGVKYLFNMRQLIKNILIEESEKIELRKKEVFEIFVNSLKPKEVQRIELGLEQIDENHYRINPRYFLPENSKLRNYLNDQFHWNYQLKTDLESFFDVVIEVGTYGLRIDR
jgi:hypothetical protein